MTNEIYYKVTTTCGKDVASTITQCIEILDRVIPDFGICLEVNCVELYIDKNSNTYDCVTQYHKLLKAYTEEEKCRRDKESRDKKDLPRTLVNAYDMVILDLDNYKGVCGDELEQKCISLCLSLLANRRKDILG